MDIIAGIHSICCALKNPLRREKELVLTDEAKVLVEKELQGPLSKIENLDVRILSPHAVQEMAKEECRERGFNYSRFPSNVFLLATPLEQKELTWLYERLTDGSIQKMVALDQVTDAHNGAAIMRTAAFYGVGAVIISSRGSFGEGPGFFRISSGATELVPIVRTSSLPKALGKIQKMGVRCLGLSEHASVELDEPAQNLGEIKCLVLGAEDSGLSHAVKRQLTELISLEPRGGIKSLNVSVASAIAMDRVFGSEAK